MFSYLINVRYCYDFFIDQVSIELLLYSHIPAALTALLFSLYVLYKAKNLPSLMLFCTCVSFMLWCSFDLNAWFAFIGAANTMFMWSLLDFTAVLMFLFGYYFLYTFITKEDLPLWQKICTFILVFPVATFSFLGLNLTGYDLNSCVAGENPTYTIYTYITEAIFISASLILIIVKYRLNNNRNEKQRILLSGIGILIFFLFFFSANFLVSQLAESDVSTYVYNYLIYGLFGMPIFLIFLGYVIVRYHAFNTKIFATQALVFGLIALIASEFAFVVSRPGQILLGITLMVISIVGWMLSKSVKKEIEQREKIENLALNLEKANVRLKALDNQKSEFVSIASHQLRSPLTAIRGYTSMLLDGTYGTMTTKATEALDRIHESAKLMAFSIEDFLNVSRIESGNMKYEYLDFNLREQVEHIVDDLRPEAVHSGLMLLFKSEMTAQGIVHADMGKTQQILHNLINNALKYTQKGNITVLVREHLDHKKFYVEFIDTGIGMSKVTIEDLFEKFSRAKNANTVNIKGTGLGLFVAREMARAMKGDITAHSEGEGMGSRFILTLPLVQ